VGKKVKKQRNGRVLFSVGFVVEETVRDDDEGDRFLEELNDLKESLDKVVDRIQGGFDPKYRSGRKEWGVNKYSGWAVYGGQFSIIANDKMMIEIKKGLKRDFQKMKDEDGGRDENLRRMRMAFWIVKKKDGDWRLVYGLK